MNLVPEQIISNFQKKNPQVDKWLRLLSDEENRAHPTHLFVSSKKCGKNIPVINNDE